MKYMYVNYSTLQVCNKRFCYIHMHNVHHKFVMAVLFNCKKTKNVQP